jgi:parallel beta-helix repeat protein
MVNASSDFDFKKLNNETFIENPTEFIENPTVDNPTANIIVSVYSNGASLADYYKAEPTDLNIPSGSWTIEQLHERFPAVIQKIDSNESNNEFFINDSVIIGKDAELNISNAKIHLYSLAIKDNNPVVIVNYGNTTVFNSTITSWDPKTNLPDPNPYHPRSFLVSIGDDGSLNIANSTISYLGFSQGGIFTPESSLAAINYYDSTGFTIQDSIISHNMYGLYTENSSNFKILNNEVYDNVGYGLDPHTGSKDFLIDSNHLFLNGQQGVICSHQCENLTITNNLIEYNSEGIGLHWLTNSSVVKDNVIKYNKQYGMFIKTNSSDNLLEGNTLIGNGYGIALLEGSNDNTVRNNTVLYNVLTEDGIYNDDTSESNFIDDNNFSGERDVISIEEQGDFTQLVQ